MDLLIQKLVEQLILVGISVSTAVLIGVPMGIAARHSQRFQSLLALLLPVFGIGMTPAIIALILYALLPILRNTIVAFQQIPREYIEVAINLGASSTQCLWKIELPLALPVMLAGIRTAVAMTIGIATIAAFIGAGGLGDFITRGLAMNNNHLLLMGAIPAALLALLLDGLFAHFQKKPRHSLWILLGIIFLIFLYIIFDKFYYTKPEIRIGTKSFTEQYILGELMAQMIEAKTPLKVDREFNLGTSEICQAAMEKGDIDIYPEYTGTAYIALLHQNKLRGAEDIFDFVKQAYQSQYHITWLSPFGFNNSQSLTVRHDFAQQYHLTTISDLVPLATHLTIGAPPEFRDRNDAYPALQKAYGINFKHIKSMDAGVMYQAISHHEVDVINAETG